MRVCRAKRADDGVGDDFLPLRFTAAGDGVESLRKASFACSFHYRIIVGERMRLLDIQCHLDLLRIHGEGDATVVLL